MIILAIETSCDETAAAIVEDGTKILSHVIASSKELHQKTGGIIPEVAAREQLKCILPVIEEAISNTQYAVHKSCRVSRVACRDIDALAVTIGPGLIGSLLVGVETSRVLSWLWQKPLIPVNHLKAHLYANFIREIPNFPAIGLIASGGHTDLILMKNHQSIKWLGGTRDDAAGECFDKCSRLLALGYPGGPAIEKAAKNVRADPCVRPSLPRPMINQDNFDFSFSGLKTAVLNICKTVPVCPPVPQLAHEIQEAITDCLTTKTIRAAQEFKVKSILVGGGVAANKRLQEKFRSVVGAAPCGRPHPQLFVPPPNLCTDNAAPIASCAYFNYQPVPWKKIKANPSLSINQL